MAAGRKQFTAAWTTAGSPVLNPAGSRSTAEVGRVSPPLSFFVLRVKTIVLYALDFSLRRLLYGTGYRLQAGQQRLFPSSLPAAGRGARPGFPTFSPHLLPAAVAGGHCSLVNPAAPAGPIAAGLQGAPQHSHQHFPAVLLATNTTQTFHRHRYLLQPLVCPICLAKREGRNLAEILNQIYLFKFIFELAMTFRLFLCQVLLSLLISSGVWI